MIKAYSKIDHTVDYKLYTYRFSTGNFVVCRTKIKEKFNPGSDGPVEQAWIFGGKIIL